MRTFKSCITKGLILFAWLALTGGTPHQFYVSLTEIRLKEATGKVEVSMRIFPDDMDMALKKITGINPQLATELEDENGDKWLAAYLDRSFNISLNGKEIELQFIGKEAETDAIWCYLEGSFNEIPERIVIKNSIMTEIFSDQKNIVQLYYKSYNKGILLDRHKTEDYLIVTE